jgi:hypothetical protein
MQDRQVDSVDKWCYRTAEATNVASSVAAVNGATYSTTTYAYQINVSGHKTVDIAMICTVPDAAISGDLTFYWFLTNGATFPKQASFTSKMTPVRNITADRANQAFNVEGYKFLKIWKVINTCGQDLLAINAEVTSE